MTAPRRPPPPIPLIVVTGFLGAGKTTLVNRLVRDPALADCVVIINEFGEIGLDHLFVETADAEMVVMASGCLCCTIRGDLVSTLEDLLRRRDNGRMIAFPRVLIETTGLADPAPVLHAVLAHPYLAMRFRLDGVVTLVDAVNGAATLDAHPEAVKQAAVADRLVITKTDLPQAAAGLAALKARLAALNPTARLLDAHAGEATAARLLDAGLFDLEGKNPDVRRWLNDEALLHRHAHAHDVNRHDARIRAFALTSDKPLRKSGFQMMMALLRDALGANLLRMKGIVALDDAPDRPLVIHAVQHVFHPPASLEAWPDDDHRSRAVFILRDADPTFVENLWRAFEGEPAVDRADAQAMADNPLKPRAGGLLG